MKIAGIIAEYNPFHNGHLYQIEQTRKITNADYIIVVLSGDFVQRGVPAIIDKYTRTQMALENGADLVLELPVVYSTGSAEFFAMGAVSLLDKLGCVDFLCFGSEWGQLKPLSLIASLLLEEPEAYRTHLQHKGRLLLPQGQKPCPARCPFQRGAFRKCSSNGFLFNKCHSKKCPLR